ncbi:MAG: 5-formyltetrahydrofolate cyclo-ligase [Actinomycetota bacterium]
MDALSSGELKRHKRRIREEIVRRRDAVPAPDRDAAALRVTDLVARILSDHSARIVMVFWSFGSELPTEGLIERLADEGRTVCLPRLAKGQMRARTYRPGDPVVETSFGAYEPADGAIVEAADLDAVLVPAVAFDRLGFRVGYGGGFYDRFLRGVRPDALRIGIGLAAQRVEQVPRGHFDLPVDLVVTEYGVDDVGGRRSST